MHNAAGARMPSEELEDASTDCPPQTGRVSRRQVLSAPAVGLGVVALDAAQRKAAAATLGGATPHRADAQRQATATPVAQPALRGLPNGMVLVASPRLPVSGVGPDDVMRLLSGEIANWAEVGSFVPLSVHPVALAGIEQPGVVPGTTAESYDELVSILRTDAGAVSLRVTHQGGGITIAEHGAAFAPGVVYDAIALGRVGSTFALLLLSAPAEIRAAEDALPATAT